MLFRSNIITELDTFKQLANSLNDFFYKSSHAIKVKVNIVHTEVPSLGLLASFDFCIPRHIKFEHVILK